MSERELILAVDIGTGATKAVLFDTHLKQIAIVRKHYPILAPRKGWSEQEPEAIFLSVAEAIGEAQSACPIGYAIRGISISSQLYSVLVMSKGGNVLSNSITWSDTRSSELSSELRRNPVTVGISRRTGCPIDPVFPLAKIKWLKENLDLPQNAVYISIKEYIMFRLTGQQLVDWSLASATGLFDIKTRAWDPAALDLLEISEANLSTLVSPQTVLRAWTVEAREKCGIRADIPLVIGGGDGPLASLGVGAATSGSLAVNVGTSAAARAVIRQPHIDPQGSLWTYLIDEGWWVIGGMVSSGGIVLEWFIDNFCSSEEKSVDKGYPASAYRYVDELASQIPAGSEGLLFIPYLSGAQCPDWSPDTRGSFIGLDLKHQRSHFARAVLEGITRSICRISVAIEDLLDKRFDEVYVTGGLTASPVWLQIAADMFGATVILPETSEGSARGAAMLAMIALGMKSGLQDFHRLSSPRERIYPTESGYAYYQAQQQRFMDALDQTRQL